MQQNETNVWIAGITQNTVLYFVLLWRLSTDKLVSLGSVVKNQRCRARRSRCDSWLFGYFIAGGMRPNWSAAGNRVWLWEIYYQDVVGARVSHHQSNLLLFFFFFHFWRFLLLLQGFQSVMQRTVRSGFTALKRNLMFLCGRSRTATSGCAAPLIKLDSRNMVTRHSLVRSGETEPAANLQFLL